MPARLPYDALLPPPRLPCDGLPAPDRASRDHARSDPEPGRPRSHAGPPPQLHLDDVCRLRPGRRTRSRSPRRPARGASISGSNASSPSPSTSLSSACLAALPTRRSSGSPCTTLIRGVTARESSNSASAQAASTRMWGGQFSTAAISGSPARESPSSPSGGRLRTGALVGEERDQRFYTGVVPELAERQCGVHTDNGVPVPKCRTQSARVPPGAQPVEVGLCACCHEKPEQRQTQRTEAGRVVGDAERANYPLKRSLSANCPGPERAGPGWLTRRNHRFCAEVGILAEIDLAALHRFFP